MFGVHPSATDGLDEILGDSELPPLPPEGILDVRFLTEGNGTMLDLRSGVSPQVEHTALFRIRRASPLPPAAIMFTWNRFLLGTMVTEARLQDAVTGTLVDIDMLDQGSYYLTDNISDFYVVFTSVEAYDGTLLPPMLNPVGAAIPDTKENQLPELSWEAAAGAASYELTWGAVPDCGISPEAVYTPVVGLSYQTQSKLPDGSYCWTARSVDVDGNRSAWASPDYFDTIPTFGEWGLLFLIASVVGVGGVFLYRRRVGSQA